MLKEQSKINWKTSISELLKYGGILIVIWFVISILLTWISCSNSNDGFCGLEILMYSFSPPFFVYEVLVSFFRIDQIFKPLFEGLLNFLGDGSGSLNLISIFMIFFTLATAYLIIFIKKNLKKLEPNVPKVICFVAFCLLALPLITNCDSDYSEAVSDEDFCSSYSLSGGSECVLCTYSLFGKEISKFSRVGGYEFPSLQYVFFVLLLIGGYVLISLLAFYLSNSPKKKRIIASIILVFALFIVYKISIFSAIDHPPHYRCTLEKDTVKQYECHMGFFDCSNGVHACDFLPENDDWQIQKKTTCYALVAGSKYKPELCNSIENETFKSKCLELSTRWSKTLDPKVFSELTTQLQGFPCGLVTSRNCYAPEDYLQTIYPEELYFYCSTRCDVPLAAHCYFNGIERSYNIIHSTKKVKEYCDYIEPKDPYGSNCNKYFGERYNY